MVFAFVGFLEHISKWNVIVGLILAVTAFVLMILSTRIVDKRCPDKSADERLQITLKIKIGCAAVAVAACLIALLF